MTIGLVIGTPHTRNVGRPRGGIQQPPHVAAAAAPVPVPPQQEPPHVAAAAALVPAAARPAPMASTVFGAAQNIAAAAAGSFVSGIFASLPPTSPTASTMKMATNKEAKQKTGTAMDPNEEIRKLRFKPNFEQRTEQRMSKMEKKRKQDREKDVNRRRAETAAFESKLNNIVQDLNSDVLQGQLLLNSTSDADSPAAAVLRPDEMPLLPPPPAVALPESPPTSNISSGSASDDDLMLSDDEIST